MTPDPRSDGGEGGIVQPDPNDHHLPDRRLRRLERMVAKAKLRALRQSMDAMPEDYEACLDTLRAGLKATGTRGKGDDAEDGVPDFRERRQSAAEILRHHRETVKMADPKATVVQVNQDNRRQLAVQLPEGWLNDPAKREAMLRLTEQSLNGSS